MRRGAQQGACRAHPRDLRHARRSTDERSTTKSRRLAAGAGMARNRPCYRRRMPRSGMERLSRWLARRVARAERQASLEAALLGGRFPAYLRRRLIPFFANRMVALL